MEAPAHWPAEVVRTYAPIKPLGKGGFGSVVLARKKKQNESGSNQDDEVAIKVVGSENVTKQERGYAHREIDILKELDHPNIMRLLDYWEPPRTDHTCAAVMALSYSKGPTLQNLLETGGALSFNFARVVAAQIVDAVTYCHSRAVLHRDIKPDNVVVSVASKREDKIWDNEGQTHNTDWEYLLKKWQVTLIDFGFARALTPDDMRKPPPRIAKLDMDASTRSAGSASSNGSNLNKSLSRLFSRQMSSLGNRKYAAPEITKDIRQYKLSYHSNPDVDVTKTLSDHVSFYGLLADAYSLGNTIKYMLTGAPPDEDVNQLISLSNHPLALLFRCVRRKKDKDTAQRTVRYRRSSDLPPEVARLIRGATHYDPQQRTSVRTMRLYPWIDDVLVDRESLPSTARHVNYLSFVLKLEKEDDL
jgi:serine/threonine protein kinase